MAWDDEVAFEDIMFFRTEYNSREWNRFFEEHIVPRLFVDELVVREVLDARLEGPRPLLWRVSDFPSQFEGGERMRFNKKVLKRLNLSHFILELEALTHRHVEYRIWKEWVLRLLLMYDFWYLTCTIDVIFHFLRRHGQFDSVEVYRNGGKVLLIAVLLYGSEVFIVTKVDLLIFTVNIVALEVSKFTYAVYRGEKVFELSQWRWLATDWSYIHLHY